MNHQQCIRLFDDWAEHYDDSIQDDGCFPFDGYDQVLDEITRAAAAQSGFKVLDLGVGTGNLAARFCALGCTLWGLDFSANMLAQAIDKVPQAVLVQADLLGDWPGELQRRFDRIVSAYVLHEFDLPTKVGLLQRLAESHLAPDGRIVIGDIAFATTGMREQAHSQGAGGWDEREYYWAADETAQACERAGLRVTYKQVSSCGGVFVIEPMGAG